MTPDEAMVALVALFDEKDDLLPANPSFIWPEARVHAGQRRYADLPPARKHFADGDLISGLLVGAADETIQWLEELMHIEGERRISLVLVLYPAGPTREEHLRAVHMLRASHERGEKTLEVCLLPMNLNGATLPPTVVQAHNTKTGRTVLSIGSVGDAGCDQAVLGSFNVVLHPDDATRDAWRRWFQYVLSSAAPLTEDTIQIPNLVPARGDPEAARLWEAFELMCKGGPAGSVTVDPNTGEVTTDADGQEVVAWDEGNTALDPIARDFQHIYASGWLVTVEEATRIKPLRIPVKAKLLGQQSQQIVGALTQKQAFTLQVLDDAVDKAIEKCRKVTDVIELLTYPLSQGNRWLPEAAKNLLEKELESRNQQGQKLLGEALGGNDIKQFIEKRTGRIRKDLDAMYSQLGQGDAVPNERLSTVLDEVKNRLTDALGKRITPRAAYNRVEAPDLTKRAPDENWNQPLSLLAHSARILRESLTNAYFQRRFSGLSFSVDDFRKACDVFGDVIIAKPQAVRAKDELSKIDDIIGAEKPAKEKCSRIWHLIRGE